MVQGIGFRPFIHNLATLYHLAGWVKNSDEGVTIHASGLPSNISRFINGIKSKAPPASEIENIRYKNISPYQAKGFKIVKSYRKNNPKQLTQIGPDIAVCNDCLMDLKKQAHRKNYPLINCTNCGPRFSIILDLPYDRQFTTMAPFAICKTCEVEYKDVTNRRFHAQPIACNHCGPVYHITLNGKTIQSLNQIIIQSASLIDNGKIIAVKGLGGFFIACNAFNQNTILKLRNHKNRDHKPFAVMFRSIENIKKYCFADNNEIELLQSWRRPVVILKEKKKFPKGVSNGLNTIGALLPYMPFQYLLFEKLQTDAIIFTSGNFSDQPIIIKNKIALKKLAGICEAIVSYNRKIFNRTDDSVVKVINGKAQLIRRSRGYTPTPIKTSINVNNILATGGELKNTFCLGRGHSAILSQHIGDLKEQKTLKYYSKNIDKFLKIFRVNPELIVHDLHPDYFSTKYARQLGLPTIAVQHHHAHIVSCMAENNLDENVIGLSFDGTGYGNDQQIWGSEFFICNLSEYNRLSHFNDMEMPGGDLVTKEPWRMGISLLYQIYGENIYSLNLPLLKTINHEKINWLLKAIDNKINCQLTSGAGRLFDAVSALLGLCYYSTFEAQAPMRLENIANHNETEQYTYEVNNEIIFNQTIQEIISDLKKGISPGKISGKFHNTVVSASCEKIAEIQKISGLKKVVLSGGTFQNKILLEKTFKKLSSNGFKVFTHSKVPANDGGLSLGQLIIAAKNRNS